MYTSSLNYEFYPSTLAAAESPRCRGTVLVDELNQIWAPNGKGGHQLLGGAASSQSAIAIGDSFQQQGWQTSATSSQTLANGWFNHFQWLSQGRFVIAQNLSVSGKRMDEVVLEQLPTALVSAAGLILLATAGTNDVTAGRTAAQIIASLQTIFGAACAAGKKVVALTIPPRGSTSFTGLAFTAPQLAVALAVNNWMRERVTFLYPNVVVVDAARRLLDTTSMANAAAFWVANALTIDGLHPNSQGAIAIAQEAAAAAAYLLPTAKRLASALSTGSVGDLANAFRNAYQIAGGGGTVGAGASGACPQYWGVGRSSGGSNTIAGACSVEARSASFNDGGAGFVTRIDLASAGAVGDRFTYYPVPIDIVPLVGESWYFAQEVDVSFSSGTLVEILAGGTVTGGATLSFTAGANVGAASWGVSAYRGVLRSRDFVIQSGATGFAFQTDIRTSAGAIGSVRFGQSELRKNPTP